MNDGQVSGGATGRWGLQALVFGLVAASINTVYLTQPVLPVLSREFAASPSLASTTVSMVILGVTLACLPFGVLADRLNIKPIIALGGLMIGVSLVAGALSQSLGFLVASRFVQGLFVPALTSCLAAYLARTLPPARLAVVMGSYVSATVAGGILSRVLSGIILDGHWRLAFVVSAALIVLLSLAALVWLPGGGGPGRERGQGPSYLGLLSRWPTLAPYLAVFGSIFIFAATFNYATYYLAGPPFGASTMAISFIYLTYLVGVGLGPLVGALNKRVGPGLTLLSGALLFMLALVVGLAPSLFMVIMSMVLVCCGHFIIHAQCQALLNLRLKGSQGRANSLYTLLYYLSGWAGITVAGQAWELFAWPGVAALGLMVLTLPAMVGIVEIRRQR